MTIFLLESILLGLREGIVTSNTYGLSVDDLLLLMREKKSEFLSRKVLFYKNGRMTGI
jgi:hypothetical protein